MKTTVVEVLFYLLHVDLVILVDEKVQCIRKLPLYLNNLVLANEPQHAIKLPLNHIKFLRRFGLHQCAQ